MGNTRTYVELGALAGILAISALMVLQGAVEEASTVLIATVSFVFDNRYGRSAGASDVYMQLQQPIPALANEKSPKRIERVIKTGVLSTEDAQRLKNMLEDRLNSVTSRKKKLKLIRIITALGAYIEYRGGDNNVS